MRIDPSGIQAQHDASGYWIFSAPGKVMLLGEYAVLGKGSAMMAAVGPRFCLQGGSPSLDAAPLLAPHPESPAGRLLAFAAQSPSGPMRADWVRTLKWSDPHEGRGGWGASTAQFALVHAALRALNPVFGSKARPDFGAGAELEELKLQPQEELWKDPWKIYRSLHQDQEVVPSGADLVVQCVGGCIRWQAEQGVQSLLDRGDPVQQQLFFDNLLLFSAAGLPGRKVATHEHLASLKQRQVDSEAWQRFESSLSAQVEQGVEALRSRDSWAFGRVLSRYAELISEFGLEVQAAREDRLAMSRVPGVCGVKGVGALLADVLLVAVDPNDPQARQRVSSEARRRGLRPFAGDS
jgi:hypothetical protein